MTDPHVADAIYLEPLTVEAVEAVIARERPRGSSPGSAARRRSTSRWRCPRRASWSATTSGCSARRSRRSGWPRTARRSATCSTGSASRTRRRRSSRARPTPPARPPPTRRSRDRPAGDHPAGVHARRHGRRHRRDRGGVPRADPGRAPGEPDRPGDGRALPRRLAGDRVRGHARRRGHVHRRVLDGERRPARRPHRRLDRRRARPDAARPGPPAAPQRGAGDHPGARRRGRLQRPVRALAGLDRVRGDRGQPARLAVVGPRSQGDRLPDRPGRRADRRRPDARRDPERRDRHDRRRVRAGARLRRRQAAALPVRQVPDGRSDARAAR